MRQIHALVEGRVQGVFFRDTTRQEAINLGLTGWVQNLEDGRVETVACGDDESISKFVGFLHKGSKLSRVDKVTINDQECQLFDGFEVRR